MFLLEPGRTPYDLNWRMFGIAVRVHPMFWAVGAILGISSLAPREGRTDLQGWALFLVWMASFFVSILVHELGHIVMGRWCGNNGHIVLYAFGGLAIPHRALDVRWQRMAVSFAGPLAGFVLFGIVAVLYFGLGGMELPLLGMAPWNLLRRLGMPAPVNRLEEWQHEAVFSLLWINLFWGLLNLLPIWPLDGGQISREICDGSMPGGQGIKVSLGISFGLAALIAVHCLTGESGRKLIPFLPAMHPANAVLFGLLAVQSFQLMQQQRTRPRRPWEDDY